MHSSSSPECSSHSPSAGIGRPSRNVSPTKCHASRVSLICLLSSDARGGNQSSPPIIAVANMPPSFRLKVVQHWRQVRLLLSVRTIPLIVLAWTLEHVCVSVAPPHRPGLGRGRIRG